MDDIDLGGASHMLPSDYYWIFGFDISLLHILGDMMLRMMRL